MENRSFVPYSSSSFSLQNRMQIIYNKDRTEEILWGQTRILNLLIEDEDVAVVLTKLVQFLESLQPEMKSSIILLDEERKRLAQIFGPSLPKEYSDAILGREIGPMEGSCGAAAYLGELVVVEDIKTDPRWKVYNEIALPWNLKACWSMPIKSKHGVVLGTFAMYYDHPMKPTPRELELLSLVVDLAAITIQKWQFQEAQKQSEQRILAQNAELSKINKELDSFVYKASHDIKAPLASMAGIINLATRSTVPGSELDVLLEHMRKSIASLDYYVKELIDHSRNLRLELSIDRIDFRKLVEQCFDNFKYYPKLKEFHWDLELLGEHDLYNDRERLSIILTNLISNCLSFSHAERPLQLQITLTTYKLQAIIVIEDNGIGIEKEYLPKIFQMFYRASENSGGSGLGLYIVKETIDRLSGHIEVSSRPGIGTAFTIFIPNHYPSEQ
jgi:signal transduction histidine kinase